MEKLSIIRKISLVHAAKCNKTTSSLVADMSFETLNKLKRLIDTNKNIGFQKILSEIKVWQDQIPIVTDLDLTLMHKN